MSRAAVLGHPVAHSLSPVLHRAAYAALGLADWRYDAFDVDGPGLPGFLSGLGPDWAGLSLTMPLKRAVLPELDVVDPLVLAVGAANTVVLEEDGRRAGYNTDVAGIGAALADAGVHRVERAGVLGAGATACSALAALRDLGCTTPLVFARDLSRTGEARAAAERLGVEPTFRTLPEIARALADGPGIDLLVSTLPVGGADALAGRLAGGLVPHGRPALLDVLYAPWPTRLAEVWSASGVDGTGAGWAGPVVGGLAMLVHQAAVQVELMTGAVAPVPAMRAAGEAELARRRDSSRPERRLDSPVNG
jgi:shikimate dehydrogenase